MGKGEAVIWLELDKTRGTISGWNGNRPTCHVERTGWKRLLELTKMLHKVKAQYVVQFEYVERKPAEFSAIRNILPLCDGARLKANIKWAIESNNPNIPAKCD